MMQRKFLSGKKRSVLSIVLLIMAMGVNAQLALVNCKAELKNDILKLNNNTIEAQYLWNNGDLVEQNILEIESNNNLAFKSSSKSGFHMPGLNNKPEKSNLAVTKVVNDLFYNDHVKVEVLVDYKQLQLKRVLRLYPNSSAIFTEYYLKLKASQGANSAEGRSCINQVALDGRNLLMKSVKFTGHTDGSNNLVSEQEALSYSRIAFNGNILTVKNKQKQQGLFLYKKAPLSEAYSGYEGLDFEARGGEIKVFGIGCKWSDLKVNEWTKGYTLAVGIAKSDSEYDMLMALRQAQMAESNYNAQRDDMVLMNTWGDRSKDGRLSESFIMNELDKCKELGVTHFQLDDGWQSGLSHNSAFKGKNKAWAKWAVKDWMPHAERFPNGLEPVVKKAEQLNIQLGLWFNPSSHNDYEAWENDADILIGLYNRYGIRIFKIDGMQINNKKGEEQFLKFYEKVIRETKGNVYFNLDVTAGKRFGYHFLHMNNNIFLENRYTDSGNYYPFRTLRNLWMLSRYMPAQSLQIEFLNKWRNTNKYGDDTQAPNKLSFDYLFAVTCMAQPLAWFEASGLPNEAFSTASVIKEYNKLRNSIHAGTILPIGNQPDGYSWTGFQSIINDKEGYIIVYREQTEQSNGTVKTWLKKGQKIKLTKVLGDGKGQMSTVVKGDQSIDFTLPKVNSFALYKYKVQ